MKLSNQETKFCCSNCATKEALRQEINFYKAVTILLNLSITHSQSKSQTNQSLMGNKSSKIPENTQTPPKEFKIITIGCGSAGKSTIFNNAQLVFKDGSYEAHYSCPRIFVDSEVISTIRENLASGICDIAHFIEEKQFSCENVQNMEFVKYLCQFEPQKTEGFIKSEQYKEKVTQFINDKVFHRVLREAVITRHIHDGFLKQIDQFSRMNQQNYKPTVSDILTLNKTTIGISSFTFKHPSTGQLVSLYDVGGIRGERRKMIRIFEETTLVLFVVALNDYFKTLFEDDTTNRMEENLQFFHDVLHSRWFTKTCIFLVFTKLDITEEFVEERPVSKYFNEYEGLVVEILIVNCKRKQ